MQVIFQVFRPPILNDTIKLNSDLLHEAFNKTLFATSNDELRLAMTGVLMQLDKNKLIVVSTDA